MTAMKEATLLTPLREQVLKLIHEHNKPLSAYELLRELRKLRPNAEPPTIYRALSYLEEHHLIHRIDSTNTYTACAKPEDHHPGQFLLCNICGFALEIADPKITAIIQTTAANYEFMVDNHLTEIRGVCKNCQAQFLTKT